LYLCHQEKIEGWGSQWFQQHFLQNYRISFSKKGVRREKIQEEYSKLKENITRSNNEIFKCRQQITKLIKEKEECEKKLTKENDTSFR